MNGNRPDTTDEDIGRRAFQLRKEKATERAIERLRGGLKKNWAAFSEHDVDDLSWILGELWAFEKRLDWEDLHFSKLTLEDTQAIILVARELQENAHNSVENLEKVGDIIRARSV